MTLTMADYLMIRRALAAASFDVSNDAVGAYAPALGEMYAPESHSAALSPAAPIVLGARGAGKSFWAGVLGQRDTRLAASRAYPRLGLERADVSFGFTGIGGAEGVGTDALNANVPEDAGPEGARTFWWATILSGVQSSATGTRPRLEELMTSARDYRERERLLGEHENRLRAGGTSLMIVYDALDTVATTWPRRRLLTEALMEVVWGMRAYRAIRPKLFLRPDQIEDDALRFVELPKLKTGAVRLQWSALDLYGLLFARLALSQDPEASSAFGRLLAAEGLTRVTEEDILSRRWQLTGDSHLQTRVMASLAGPYMAEGRFGYKKGSTYSWPLAHLADAFGEVTPRSFLGMMIAAAKFGVVPPGRVLTPDGLRHGLRAASKTRVDQLHEELPWIKAVLAPLAGLLLPQLEEEVFRTWRQAGTVQSLAADSVTSGYLPPFPMPASDAERSLFVALERIGVMSRRKDGRLDMPDLFRVAAKLLKKGGTAPL